MISLVRAFGIIGGGVALVGATAVTGLLGLSPGALAVGVAGKLSEYTKIEHTNIFEGAGAAGIGGSLLAQSMCASPLYCTTASGQCCLVAFDLSNGLVCPDTG